MNCIPSHFSCGNILGDQMYDPVKEILRTVASSYKVNLNCDFCATDYCNDKLLLAKDKLIAGESVLRHTNRTELVIYCFGGDTRQLVENLFYRCTSGVLPMQG